MTCALYTMEELTDILSNLHVHDGLITLITESTLSCEGNDSIGIGEIIQLIVAICIIISIGVCTYMYFRYRQNFKV
jgi:hypothetical protein